MKSNHRIGHCHHLAWYFWYCAVFDVPNTALHFLAKELKFSLIRPQNILPTDFMFCPMASSKFQADFMLACLKGDFLLADLPKRHKTSNAQHLVLSRQFPPFHSNCSAIPCRPSGILVIFLTNALFIQLLGFVRWTDLRSILGCATLFLFCFNGRRLKAFPVFL